MLKSILCLLTISIICGCSTSPVKNFTFTPLEQTTMLKTEPVKKIVLLQTIEFPDYLQTRNIAVRKSENELMLSEMNNWAQPFDVQVTRYMSELLRQSTSQVELITSTRYTTPDSKLRIHILSFEKNDEKERVELSARWWALDGETNKITKHGVFSESLKTDDSSYQTSAAVHSLLIKKFVDTLLSQL